MNLELKGNWSEDFIIFVKINFLYRGSERAWGQTDHPSADGGRELHRKNKKEKYECSGYFYHYRVFFRSRLSG